MKVIFLRKYKRVFKKKNYLENYLVEGLIILRDRYTYFDCTLIVDKSEKNGDAIFSNSQNNIYGGVIYLDPERAFKEDYQEKDLTTLARQHCANIKKADIPLKQKRLMDFVLGVAHEVGHIRAGHGRFPGKVELYDDIKGDYRQSMEKDAEREVYVLANQLKYKDKTWLEIIEPEPLDNFVNIKDLL